MPRKARYFALPEKPKFSWASDQVQAPPHLRKTSNYPHYAAFTLGNLDAGVGDFIIVKSDDSNDDLLSCDVARIESLYEDSSEVSDPYRALVTWLCRPSELPKQVLQHGFEEQGVPPLDQRLDVVLEARNFETNISAETIYFKCNVFSQPMAANPEKFIKSCPESKYPNYILRFKMRNTAPGKKRKSYILEAYTDGGPSPLKISRTVPLSVRNQREMSREKSPAIAPIPKLIIPANLGYLLQTSGTGENKKRRRLSSREASRENTPLKKSKKSSSVPVSPEIGGELLKTPGGGGGGGEHTGLNGGYWGTDSPKRTPKPKNKDDPVTPKSSTKTPIRESRQKDAKTPVRETRRKTPAREPSQKDSKTPLRSKTPSKDTNTPSKDTKTPSKDTKPLRKDAKTPGKDSKTPAKDSKAPAKDSKTPAKEAKTPKNAKNKIIEEERFTEVHTKTGSGRKVKISCGVSKAKVGPSLGLGDSEIISLLDSGDDFDEETNQNSAKSKKAPLKKPRRASLAVMERKKEQVSSVKKKAPLSETKKSKRVAVTPEQSSESDLSDSESDFEDSVRVKNQKNKCSDSEEQSSEDERQTLSKKSAKSATTKSAKSAGPTSRRSSVFTPGVAARARPVVASANPLVEAQERLHVSAVPDSLPCREDEFAEVFGYVEGKLQEGTGGCIYISGVPGTGKTATVKQVMRYMEENSDEFPEFKFYEMNGMRLTCPEQTYVEMWRLLTGEKLVHEQAMKRLDQRFATPAPRRTHTVFLIDELDMLCKKKQTVLYNVFEWSSRPQAKVIIIAIANTMDLPERDMDMRVISRLGLNRLHFEPYNQQQLQAIVSSRLEGLEVFQSDEIQLVSRKVASLSGDARRALDICRILTERCEREGRDRVTQIDVQKVHKEMFTSPKMMYIRSCSKVEQYFLRALVTEFYRTGVEETSFRNIYTRFDEVCSLEGQEVPSLHAAVDISARLSSQRLILSEDYRKGLETKLRLNVGVDDISFALNPRNE